MGGLRKLKLCSRGLCFEGDVARWWVAGMRSSESSLFLSVVCYMSLVSLLTVISD